MYVLHKRTFVDLLYPGFRLLQAESRTRASIIVIAVQMESLGAGTGQGTSKATSVRNALASEADL